MFFPADAPTDRPGNELRALRFSMNAPVVALEGLPVGPARAAVALHQGPETRVTVALRAVRSGQLLFFCAGEELAELPSVAVAVDAALSFAESMGFLFDDDVVESSAVGGGREAADQWDEFIDATTDVRPQRAPSVPPAARAPRSPLPAEPARIVEAPRPPPGPDDLAPLAASMPADQLESEVPPAPLAMLEDDTTPDELPFWLLQPDPPRRSAPPQGAAAAPNSEAERGPEPALQASAPELAPRNAEKFGLMRKPSAPSRARTAIAPVSPAPRDEAPLRRLPRQPSREPEPPRPASRPVAKRRARRAETSAPAPAKIPGELLAALAETGIDQLLTGGGSGTPTREASASAEAPRCVDSAPRFAVAEPPRAAAATLSKFRIHASAAPKVAATRTLDSRALADERDSDPEPRREFESLELRLRSRF